MSKNFESLPETPGNNQTNQQLDQEQYYLAPDIFASSKASQFKAPFTPRKSSSQLPHSAMPTIPDTPPIEVPIPSFPVVPTTPRLNLPASLSVGAGHFRKPATPFLAYPGEVETDRHPAVSSQIQMLPHKTRVRVAEQATQVLTALPRRMPPTPFSGNIQQQVRALPVAGQYAFEHPSNDYALDWQKHSTIAGQLQEMQGGTHLAFTSIFSTRAKILLWIYLVCCLLFNVAFIIWIISPQHIIFSSNPFIEALLISGLVALTGIEFIRIIQGISLSLFALYAKDPVPLTPVRNLRVAVLTTIVPSKEPVDVLEKTLRAMKAMAYGGTVDVWVLDEGNDPTVIRLARQLGVLHFSRKGHPQFNQPSGEFKEKTKAGNHNSWRALYEDHYDIVAQMDPDHIPFPNFLERTLGYFKDPDVAFVVAPQVYGNLESRRLTKAAAAQAFIFHGLIQRGGNGLGTPLLIGTNHLYRPMAWKQIRGYQDSIIEDHLTSITIQGAKNPVTGHRWRGVYTPDILSVGEGPSSWTDYFNQQKRWAYGVWEIMLRHDWKLLRRLSPAQRLAYILLQLFYPGVAMTWILGALLMFFNLALGISSIGANSIIWGTLWTISVFNQVGLYFWLSKLNLVKNEKAHYGIHAMFLTLFTAPVYASAALQALRRKKLEYNVTAKGNLQTVDRLQTFASHLKWYGLISLFISLGLIGNRIASASFAWALFADAILIIPVLLFLYRKKPSDTKVLLAERDTKPLYKVQHLINEVDKQRELASPGILRSS